MDLNSLFDTFMDEAGEMLQQMEAILLRLESGTQEADDLHALFRSAHTIKGSAGIFNLQAIVDFTHVVENVLDLLRSEKISFSEDLLALLLACQTHMAYLIHHCKHDVLPPEIKVQEAQLLDALAKYSSVTPSVGETRLVPAANATPMAVPVETILPAENTSAGHWHLSLRFNSDVLALGLDPLSMIRYLGKHGTFLHVETLAGDLPGFDAFDPQKCYLGFELAYETQSERTDIEDAFEFVRSDGDIRIIAPHSGLQAFEALLAARQDERERVLQCLRSCQTLTTEQCAMLAGNNAVVDGQRKTTVETGVLLDRVELIDGGALVDASVVAKQLPVSTMSASVRKEPLPPSATSIDDRLRGENRFIKISADKLDRLIDLVGELVIAGAGTRMKVSRLSQPDLLETINQQQDLVEEVRDTALGLRMVQVGEIFSRFPRVVRDLSKDIGKEIDLKISGQDTELDKAMIEKVADPLMHIVRNAIDHGIESPDERESAGKPRHGVLHLAAYHQSGGIVIELRDDGRGLDKAKILQKAIEKNLVAADAILSDHDIFNLVLMPGFSTADKITNLSGRGVGMDVVKSNVEALRGQLQIDSRPGQGTCMRMCLPLTLAIIDAFQIGVGHSTFVLPLEMVSECIEVPVDVGEREYLNLRGHLLPFVRLSSFLKIPNERATRRNIVVVQCGDKQAGIEVDNLYGECQAVIKPLGELFKNVRGISGTTILGSGDVAMILDVPQLIEQAVQQQNARHVH